MLSKARFLPKEIRIKPDLSQEERQIESLLLKERWVLIQAGTERKAIKIRGTKIFVSNKLHGQIINSSFVSSEVEQIETEIDSSSTWLPAQSQDLDPATDHNIYINDLSDSIYTTPQGQ